MPGMTPTMQCRRFPAGPAWGCSFDLWTGAAQDAEDLFDGSGIAGASHGRIEGSGATGLGIGTILQVGARPACARHAAGEMLVVPMASILQGRDLPALHAGGVVLVQP